MATRTEGYSRVQNDAHYTQFVIKCIEVTSLSPTPHVTGTCARVRANANFDPKLFADVLFFIDRGPKQPESANAPPEMKSEIAFARSGVTKGPYFVNNTNLGRTAVHLELLPSLYSSRLRPLL